MRHGVVPEVLVAESVTPVFAIKIPKRVVISANAQVSVGMRAKPLDKSLP